MVDFSKLKVEEIKQMILDEEWFTVEQLEEMDIKGKSQWVNLYKSLNPETLEHGEELFTFEENKQTEVKIVENNNPTYDDPKWQDYVMSNFERAELIDGKYPSVNGLRRVVELLLGEIVNAGPIEIKTTMDSDSPGKAVVTYEIQIAWKLNCVFESVNFDGYPIKTFRAVGSSWHGNTDDMYAVFPEAIAETRAEGRALRRALRLGVVCADELTKKNTAEIVRQKVEKSTDGNWDESESIKDNQISSIKILCDRLNIDLVKFINSGSKQYKDITEVSRQTAANMIKKLNEYQNSSNSSSDIPIEILKG